MLNRKAFFLCVLIILSGIRAFCLDNPEIRIQSDTAFKGSTQDEKILLNMINDIRRQAKMPLIPFSSDLCKVAHVHINDLIISKPQEKGCSLHSWSSAGKWTSCCQTRDAAGLQCMKSKPREIVGYQGNGYELIYYGDESATPADAAALWKQVEASMDMILCRGKWKEYEWKAMGVGLKGGYAALWLGDKPDKSAEAVPKTAPVSGSEPAVKKKVTSEPEDSEVMNFKTEPVGTTKSNQTKKGVVTPVSTNSGLKYYLIVASVKTQEAANSELKRFKSKGYPDALILEGDNVYRIGILSFDDNIKASRKQNELKKDFPGIWIYKK